MMDLRKVAAHYGGRGSGNQCSIPTPGHSKHDLGTSITIKASATDGVLIKCHNGTDADALAVKDMLRSDGFLPPREARETGNDNHAEPWRCTGTYEYDDGDGRVLYRTRRQERAGSRKKFVAERLAAGQWVSGLGDVERVPYRFTAIRKAFERAALRDEPMPVIYFAEGERKADKLAEWGFLSTAIAFGCKGWRKDYSEAFRDATVIILPDNDEPGRDFARTVKGAVDAVGGKGVILELPRLGDGGDIVDWDGTPDELRTLADKALAGGLLPMPTLDLAALAQTRAKPKAFAIERIAPLAEVTMFTGPGAAGKSLLGQQLATASAAALSCLGLGIQSGPAIYLTCEDDAEQLHWRQEHLCAALGVDMAALAGKLHLVSLRGEIGNELATFAPDGKISPTTAFRRLSDMIKVTGAKLAFLDNVAHLFAGNENDRGDVTRFVNLLNKLAGETGAAIILLGHPNKAGDEWSGSTAWPNAVRSRIYLEHDEETDVRTLSLPKANYGQKGEVARFRWVDWAFVRDEDLPDDTRAQITEVIKANGENAAFLACLRARAEQGEGRGVGPAPGPNYAPSQFEGMPEAKGYKKPALKRAMDRLFAIGMIKSETFHNKAKKRDVTIIVEVPERSPNAFPNASRTHFPNAPEVGPNTPRAHSLYTTYIPGAALEPAAPDDDLDWGTDGEGEE